MGAPIMSTQASRREFLRASARLSCLGAAAPFALNLATLAAASAQTAADDYKALVCVFLYGGNDHFNTVIPYDNASYAEYQKARGAIARDRTALLKLTPVEVSGAAPDGREFAVPGEWAPVQQLFDTRRAAVIANVGPLIEPATAALVRNSSVRLPPKLYSHNDQQSVWQANSPEGADFGWGGRMGDLLAASNNNATFTCVSVAGQAVWLSGRDTTQYQVTPAGSVAINALGASSFAGSDKAPALLRQLITAERSHLLEKDHAAVLRRSLAADAQLRAALTGEPAFATTLPENNSLAAQLRMVARLIRQRQTLGAKRQVFFVSLGGFDHHALLTSSHPPLLATTAQAIDSFVKTLAELKLDNNVTLFTASDFGRALSSNGDGSDHGWGGHHIVVGGAVRGAAVYGRMPTAALGTDTDAGQGRLVPTTAVDQYAATLARWFGLSDSQLDDVLPNLKNFPTRTLGFL
jgi:uncharacterized protein (DUF1501 family)